MSIDQFKLSYELSPITLTGGTAASLPGGMQPIISLTQAQDFTYGITSESARNLTDEDFLAHFRAMPGSTLEDIANAKYSFANQQVAANAIIVQPLHIGLIMEAPAPTGGGYIKKLAAFTSLKQALDAHIIAGGTFIVATPAYIYQNCLLLGLRDVTDPGNPQVQARWQWEFEQPLITLSGLRGAQNTLMSKISTGVMAVPNPLGVVPTSGVVNATGDPASGVAQPLLPAALGPAANSVQVGQSVVTLTGADFSAIAKGL